MLVTLACFNLTLDDFDIKTIDINMEYLVINGKNDYYGEVICCYRVVKDLTKIIKNKDLGFLEYNFGELQEPKKIGILFGIINNNPGLVITLDDFKILGWGCDSLTNNKQLKIVGQNDYHGEVVLNYQVKFVLEKDLGNLKFWEKDLKKVKQSLKNKEFDTLDLHKIQKSIKTKILTAIKERNPGLNVDITPEDFCIVDIVEKQDDLLLITIKGVTEKYFGLQVFSCKYAYMKDLTQEILKTDVTFLHNSHEKPKLITEDILKIIKFINPNINLTAEDFRFGYNYYAFNSSFRVKITGQGNYIGEKNIVIKFLNLPKTLFFEKARISYPITPEEVLCEIKASAKTSIISLTTNDFKVTDDIGGLIVIEGKNEFYGRVEFDVKFKKDLNEINLDRLFFRHRVDGIVKQHIVEEIEARNPDLNIWYDDFEAIANYHDRILTITGKKNFCGTVAVNFKWKKDLDGIDFPPTLFFNKTLKRITENDLINKIKNQKPEFNLTAEDFYISDRIYNPWNQDQNSLQITGKGSCWGSRCFNIISSDVISDYESDEEED